MLDDSEFMLLSISPGDVIEGRYQILKQIAIGGMGTVYQCADLKNDLQLVAIKFLHAQFHEDQSLVARFARESQVLNTFTHPNIVRVIDLVVKPHLVFLVTEFIQGAPLDQVLIRRQLSFDEFPDMITQISLGLYAVHQRGIVHRDLKPQNILIQSDGVVKLIDFGSARTRNSRLTMAGQKVGTTAYLAPEIWLDQQVTPAADFYSLGVILYQAATGRLPFASNTLENLMLLHTRKDPVPVKQINPNTPDWLEQLVGNLLQKSPIRRYQSAEQVLSFLKRKLSEQPPAVAAKPFPSVYRAAPGAKSSPSEKQENRPQGAKSSKKFFSSN